MYLIIGANGFLGSYIIKNILENTNSKIIAVCRDTTKVIEFGERVEWRSCDIESFKQVDDLTKDLEENKCKYKVIYLAAYHNPDLVEKNKKKAWNVNVTSLSYFLNQINNVDCLFYPSTDTVYGDGETTYHFKESDKLSPVNTYGQQKCLAEHLVTAYEFNVVRYPFLIAPSILTYKKHFYDKILDTISDGKPMEMFKDSFRSSLDFNTAAQLLINIMEIYSSTIPKILNISGDDDLSKYDVGILIAKKYGIDSNLIVPISASDASDIFEAKRAKSTLMDNRLVKKILNLQEIKIEI